MDRLFQRSRELLETIKRDYPKVMVEQMIVEHESAKGIYLNSLGAEYETLEGSYSLSLMFSGHDGDKTSSFNGAGVSTDSLDTPLIELGALRQLLSDAEKQIDTVATDGKFVGPVVFTPDCAGSMIYELLGNFVTDGVILDGTSLWKDKLGQMVADPCLTISAAPLHPAIVCGERYTSDGRVSQDYDIIKDGRLNAFALSSYVANKTGHKAAPNASFSLIVPAGSESIRDIIAGIDRGLLVSRFSGGSPSSSGDFSGVAKNSFLIENGQIGPAVSETMISGNLAGMFEKLRGISSERVQDGSSLLPYIAVDGITISGK
jgi:PmbA protein